MACGFLFAGELSHLPSSSSSGQNVQTEINFLCCEQNFVISLNDQIVCVLSEKELFCLTSSKPDNTIHS